MREAGGTASPADAETASGRTGFELLRRALGAALVALTLLPLHLLLEPGRIGPFGSDVRAGAAANLEFAWWGVALALVVGAGLALLTPAPALRRALGGAARRLERPSLGRFAAGTAALGGALALLSTLVVFRGLPTGVDEMASLLHARYLAQGHLAGPVPADPPAYLVLNTVLTPAGWISFYPPAHPLLLAAGMAAGAVWLVPSLLVAGLAGAATVAAHRILGPDRIVEARSGGVLVALSPFVFLLGGSYLSHVSAAPLLAGALVAALAARRGSAWWSVAAGAALGVAVTSRPWTSLVVGLGLTGGLWVADAVGRRRSPGWLLRRLGGAAAGGTPLAAAWLVYNRRFFGDPLTVGYTYAYGPAHGLGFHRDPWSNAYGPVEALGFTAADLQALSVHLLETPLPLVALVGLWLLAARKLPPGTGILLAWALLPVAANLFYWHHGSHLGPRMLYEAAPAWILLTVLAAVGTVRSLGEGRDRPGAPGEGGGTPEPDRRRAVRLTPRRIVSFALAACLAAAPFLSVMRARVYTWSESALARLRAPSPGGDVPALVFVHGSWAERVSARLQAAGMRMDSVETALRRNDICALHRYALGRARSGASSAGGARPSGGGGSPVELDLRPLPGTPDHLRFVELSPGNRVRVDPRAVPSPGCRREARSDRLGVVALAPLLWQGDLPGLEEGRPALVRDLGPEANLRVLERHPERRAFVYYQEGPERPPTLRPYDEAIARLWGE